MTLFCEGLMIKDVMVGMSTGERDIVTRQKDSVSRGVMLAHSFITSNKK